MEERDQQPRELVVSVSGGKDSTATLLYAVEQAESKGDRVIPVFQDTGFEHPAVYEYLAYLEQVLELTIERVRSEHYESVPDVCEQKSTVPTHMGRVCTGELKIQPMRAFLLEHGFHRRTAEVWMGIRSAEGAARKKKYGHLTAEDTFTVADFGNAYRKKELRETIARCPIVEWTEADVWEIHKAHGLHRNPLYSSGHARVGCFPCILAGKPTWIRAYQDPVGRANIERLAEAEEAVSAAKDRFTYFQNIPEGVRAFIEGMERGEYDERKEVEDTVKCSWCHD